MKKFSKILESSNNYYKVEATIELLIQTENEGEAGYIADSILSSVENSSNYTIINIDRSNMLENKEPYMELYPDKSNDKEQSNEQIPDEDKILLYWDSEFGDRTPTSTEKMEFYRLLRNNGIDGILIHKVLKNKI